MGPALPFNWQDELEQLRREQNPGKYAPRTPDTRPALHLPIPVMEHPYGGHPPENEPEVPVVLIFGPGGPSVR